MITENEAVKKIENAIEDCMKDVVLYVCEFGYVDADDFDAVGHDYACVYLLIDTAKDLVTSGATSLVVGSFLLNSYDIRESYKELENI